VLLDVVMPDMDGFEVCRRLRAHKLLAEVPIIMITSLEDKESRLKGIEAGADDFISKPFDNVELRTRVRSITRLNRYRRLLVERVRFRWVVERAEEGYLIVDDDDAVLYANPRARLYFDIPEDAKLPPDTIFLEWAKAHYNLEPQDAWATWPDPPPGDAPRYLVRPESANARAFWLQVDMLALPSGPDMAGTVRLRDVTAQMNTIRDMRNFSAVVTHKLRTPLINIVGNLDMLARFYKERLADPEVAELFELAHQGSKRLSGEIDDVLRYLHDLPVLAQAGEAFNLAKLRSTVALMNAELELGAVHVDVEGRAADTCVALSERAVELILWELLENAKKFHPRHAPTVEVAALCLDPGHVCLRVSDDGVHLSPEQLAQVWTPYYQGEKQFTGEVPGMGLGLTMVANLVWSVGGTCKLYNLASGPGIVVDLTLPIRV
jgi:signal transduction histidine kinase